MEKVTHLPKGGRLPLALAGLLLIGFAVRVVYLLVIPAWEAPDERAHFSYVAFLYQNHTLPLATPDTVWNVADNSYDDVSSQYQKPPLAYLLYLPVYAAARACGLADDAILLWLRLLSALLSLPTIALAWSTASLISGNRSVTLATASVCALTPALVYSTCTVGNTTAMMLLTSAVFFMFCQLLADHEGASSRGIWLGAVLGMSFCTLQSGLLTFLAVLVSAAVLEGRQQRATARPLWIAVVVALAVAGPYVAFNLQHYGDPLAAFPYCRPAPPRSWPDVLRAQEFLLLSFWGSFGRLYELNTPWASPTLFATKANCLIALASAAVFGAFCRHAAREWSGSRDPVRLFAGVCVALFLLATEAYVYKFGYRPGRYLYPVIIPIALGVAYGSYELTRTRAGVLTAVLSLGLAVYFLYALLIPYYAT